MKDWKECSHKVWYYWKTGSGLIIGQVNHISLTEIYLAKAFTEVGEEKYLGHYVNSEFARKAVEGYWNMQERVITHEDF